MAIVTEQMQLDVTAKGVTQTTAQFKTMNSAIGGIAKSIGTLAASYLTLTTAMKLFADSNKAWKEQEQAIRKVNAGLQSTGNYAGYSLGELEDMADRLQRISNYGDDDILGNAINSLIRFRNINKDILPIATQLSLDLAAQKGEQADLAGIAENLGRALEKPASASRMLRSMNIMLTDSETKLISELSKAGKTAEAQQIILDLLTTKVGGTAKATVDFAFQAKNAWKEYLESLGKQTSPILKGVQSAFASFFYDLADANKSGGDAVKEANRNMYVSMNRYALAGMLNIQAAGQTLLAVMTQVINQIDTTIKLASSGWFKSLADTINIVVNRLPKGLIDLGALGDLGTLSDMASEVGNAWKKPADIIKEWYSTTKANISDLVSVFTGYEKKFEDMANKGLISWSAYEQSMKALKQIAKETQNSTNAITASETALAGYVNELQDGFIGALTEASAKWKEFYKYAEQAKDLNIAFVPIDVLGDLKKQAEYLVDFRDIYKNSLEQINAQIEIYKRNKVDQVFIDKWAASETAKAFETMRESWAKEHEIGYSLMSAAVNSLVDSLFAAIPKIEESNNAIVNLFKNMASAIIAELNRIMARGIINLIINTMIGAVGGSALKIGGALFGGSGVDFIPSGNIASYAGNGAGLASTLNTSTNVPTLQSNSLIGALQRIERAVIDKPVPELRLGDEDLSRHTEMGNLKRNVIGVR